MKKQLVTLVMEPASEPIWFYRPVPEGKIGYGIRGIGIDNPLYDDEELWAVLKPLQEEFDKTCFVDGGFEVVGFASDEVMEAFNDQLEAAYAFLRVHLEEKYPGEYEVVEHPRAYFSDRMAVY